MDVVAKVIQVLLEWKDLFGTISAQGLKASLLTLDIVLLFKLTCGQ